MFNYLPAEHDKVSFADQIQVSSVRIIGDYCIPLVYVAFLIKTICQDGYLKVLNGPLIVMALHNTEAPFGSKPSSRLFSIEAIISTPTSTPKSCDSQSFRKHRRREGKRRSLTPERSSASPRRQQTPDEKASSTPSPTARPIPVYPVSISDPAKSPEIRR